MSALRGRGSKKCLALKTNSTGNIDEMGVEKFADVFFHPNADLIIMSNFPLQHCTVTFVGIQLDFLAIFFLQETGQMVSQV